MKSHLSKTAQSFLVLTAGAFLLNACGSESSSFPPDQLVPPIVRKLEVSADEIREPQGCLNVARLFEKIQQTPEGTVVREVTTNFRLGNSSSGRPRSLFVRGLALKAFVFNETAPDQLQRPSLQQVGCETVVAQGPYGPPVEAKIEAWTENSVDLVYESRRETYRLLSPTLVEVVRTGRALDDCSREQVLFPVETTTRLTWASPEMLEAQWENLEINFVKVFTDALNESPLTLGQALRDPFQTEDGVEVVQMGPELLRDLAAIEETVLTKRCSELPEATPTPAPTPVRPPPAKPRSIIDIFFDWFR